jgi:hypothetical protein
MNKMYDEMNLKQAQEKLAYADSNQCPSPSDLGQMAGQAMACEESTTSKLQRKLRTAEADHAKNSHALDILTRHPEFEEFLWLLRANVL